MEHLEKRINRIVGQLKGIEKMVSEGRSCNEVLQQVSAVKKAIDGLTKEFVVQDVGKYVPSEKLKDVERVIERAISL